MNTITPFTKVQSINNIENTETIRRPSVNIQAVDRVEKVTQKGLTEKSEKMLLSLLKSGITGEKPDVTVFENATPVDWHKVIEMGFDASTTAILSDGAKDLPKGMIPTTLFVR